MITPPKTYPTPKVNTLVVCTACLMACSVGCSSVICPSVTRNILRGGRVDESAPLPLDNSSSDLNGLHTSVLPIVAVAFYKYCIEYVDKCTICTCM